MIRFPIGKLHNAYIIETHDYEYTKKAIMDFAIINGFDKKLVYSQNHPDIMYIEDLGKENMKFSLRNDVVDTTYYAPKVNDKKFYILYDVMFLSPNHQNILLKTLEEPPTFVTFFLVTSNVHSLLDTVKSRAIIIKDDKEDDYKRLLELEFTDDAVLHLSNIKYESDTDKMLFAEIFLKKEDRFRDLIKLYRYVIRDALFYKMTLSKDKLYLKEKETEIISLANSLEFEELGSLVDAIDYLSKLMGYNVDKKIAVFNFLSGGKHGKMFRN